MFIWFDFAYNYVTLNSLNKKGLIWSIIIEMEDVCQLYFRSAVLNDCQAIYKVHVSSIRSVCGGSGLYTPQQIDLWVNRQSVDRYVDPITTDRVMVACEIGNDLIVGFEFIDDNTMEIKTLYVSPDRLCEY